MSGFYGTLGPVVLLSEPQPVGAQFPDQGLNLDLLVKVLSPSHWTPGIPSLQFSSGLFLSLSLLSLLLICQISEYVLDTNHW